MFSANLIFNPGMSMQVPRSNLHRKLFKNPGSVSYRRLLPFLMDFTKDEYGNYFVFSTACISYNALDLRYGLWELIDLWIFMAHQN